MANILSKRKCPNCDHEEAARVCSECGTATLQIKNCGRCGKLVWGDNLLVIKNGNGMTRCKDCSYKNHKSWRNKAI